MRFLFMFCLAASQSFAGTWFGRLVDTNCYEAAERNINPTSTLMYVNRDQNSEIRYCAPKAKTKSFTIVEPSGMSFMLDSAGDTRAADLLREPGWRPGLYVNVTGEMTKNTIKVSSIVPAK